MLARSAAGQEKTAVRETASQSCDCEESSRTKKKKKNFNMAVTIMVSRSTIREVRVDRSIFALVRDEQSFWGEGAPICSPFSHPTGHYLSDKMATHLTISTAERIQPKLFSAVYRR